MRALGVNESRRAVVIGAGRRVRRPARCADARGKPHQDMLSPRTDLPRAVTLLELVWEVGDQGCDEQQIVMRVSRLLREYRVSLRGNFRGTPVEELCN